MEIEYIVGDATDPPRKDPGILVHVCNDVRKWDRGFVVAISRRWQEPEKHFRSWYRGGESVPYKLGQVLFVPVEEKLWVANLVGQHGIKAGRYGPPVRYEAIREGLKRVADFAQKENAVVHMPRIGCGLAGGTWDRIEAILNEELIARNIAVYVYDLPV